MPLLVVYNPVSGDRSGGELFKEHVLPLLKEKNVIPDRLEETTAPGHVGALVADFLATLPASTQTVSVVLGSGDGTLHELINALNNLPSSKPLPRLNIALVPCGTANALYASLFPRPRMTTPSGTSSKHHRRAVPLNLAVTVLSPPPVTSPGQAQAQAPRQVSISAVVASTALHASILHDSEALRASDPSMGRFKTAAMQNITRWYGASVTLFPRDGAGVVEAFDPAAQAFVPHEASTEDEPIVDLTGPFAYFLSTVNVDRLEPQFRISPRGRDVLAPEERSAALDVVIVRPMRDPSYEMDSEEARARFAEKAGAVLGAAYQDGAHVNLRYDESGKIVAEGTGPTVVEYIRCGGWVWEPDEIDERAHLVCADGDILTIPKGGKARCTAATPMNDTTGFAIYV
ncbi:ATP-NAD kinase-like domain-containing protein [Cerioporus squamosus]|nr:ATP-NAD kinase-like domain-containing protein [Cerioporus squamosus]